MSLNGGEERILKRTNAEGIGSNKKAKPSSEDGLTEKDVGITAYITPKIPGFKGLMKQRHADFQVNEIMPDGKVVHLTDPLAVRPKKTDEERKLELEEKKLQAQKTKEECEGLDAQTETPSFDISAENKKELIDLLGEAFVVECIDFVNGRVTEKSRLVSTETFNDKSVRTKVHQLYREAFEGKLATSTSAENAFVVSLSTPARSKKRSSGRNAGNSTDFLHFTLYKENRDTMEAVSIISKFLRIPSRSVSFAGTKDRRAVTAQRLSLHKGNVGRMTALNEGLPMAIRIGDFQYEKFPLRLGDLKGNEFWIAIRNLEGPVPSEALESLRDRGFINYFGLQRFGTFSISTHTLGKAILKGDYDAAVAGILEPQGITLPDSLEARKIWVTQKDAAAALELMPRKCVAEVALLTALKESPNSLNALLRIPRSLKTMYLHAYQSYVWNRVASDRIAMGIQLLAGDLVIDRKQSKGAGKGEYIIPRKVEESDIASGQLDVFDVVLPTPGFDVVYPENLVETYKSVMEEDDLDAMNMRRSIKEFSLPGSYRPILAKPINVEWWLRKYQEDEATLVRTDKELLIDPSLDKVVDDVPEGEKTALILRLGLNSSQYATMALREAMKLDTGRHGGIYFG